MSGEIPGTPDDERTAQQRTLDELRAREERVVHSEEMKATSVADILAAEHPVKPPACAQANTVMRTRPICSPAPTSTRAPAPQPQTARTRRARTRRARTLNAPGFDKVDTHSLKMANAGGMAVQRAVAESGSR